MKIIYFSTGYTPHDHRFLSALAATPHQIFYLKLEGNLRQVEDRPVPSRIEMVPWAGGHGKFHWGDLPRLVLDLKRVIRTVKPDLIHAGPIQTCALISVLSGFRPLLTMSWGFDLMQDAERNGWWKNVTRYTLKRSTFFTSDANVTRARAIGYGMNPDRTTVIPWGVDLKHFQPPASRARKKGPTTILCNRSWEPRYGVDVLARAFVKVVQQNDDVNLLLLSAGSQAQAIRQILLNGGALERSQFPGQISQTDLPRWYHMADLFISPSHVDGSSVSLMEALACGVPALVSDIPANKEWVSEGQNGWLFPDGDVDALASRILAIIADKRKFSSIRRAARKSAEEKADWKKNFVVLLKTYESAIRLR